MRLPFKEFTAFTQLPDYKDRRGTLSRVFLSGRKSWGRGENQFQTEKQLRADTENLPRLGSR